MKGYGLSKNGSIMFGTDYDLGNLMMAQMDLRNGLYRIGGIADTKAERKIEEEIDHNKVFKIIISINFVKRTITMDVDNDTVLTTELPGDVTNITHYGISCHNSPAYFSDISISGE